MIRRGTLKPARLSASGSWRTAVTLAALSLALLALLSSTPAQTRTPAQQKAMERETQARALLAKYTASPGREDTDGFLREPAVRAQLQRVAGNQLPRLMQNLEVRTPIDFVGGGFRISGNAPHQGTEEEAVICVSPFGPVVEAAIFSRGKITVFATAEQYEYMTLCVKDWITQVNSGHRDRFTQPKNVTVQRPK
jgi:hypothetical protein